MKVIAYVTSNGLLFPSNFTIPWSEAKPQAQTQEFSSYHCDQKIADISLTSTELSNIHPEEGRRKGKGNKNESDQGQYIVFVSHYAGAMLDRESYLLTESADWNAF